MSDYVTEIACDHCGDVAAHKADGVWTDGEEVDCPQCGAEWQVSFGPDAPDVYLIPRAT